MQRAIPRLFGTAILTATLNCAVVAPAQDAVQTGTNYYKVAGATAFELRRSIDRSHPRKDRDAADARTEWNIQWTYTHVPVAGGCRLRSLELKTTIHYTLPQWTPGPGASDGLMVHWTKYRAALAAHEDGHGRIARAAALEIRRRVTTLKAQPTTDQLEKAIHDTANQVMAEYRERDAQYDQKTRHGATQGARFP